MVGQGLLPADPRPPCIHPSNQLIMCELFEVFFFGKDLDRTFLKAWAGETNEEAKEEPYKWLKTL